MKHNKTNAMQYCMKITFYSIVDLDMSIKNY